MLLIRRAAIIAVVMLLRLLRRRYVTDAFEISLRRRRFTITPHAFAAMRHTPAMMFTLPCLPLRLCHTRYAIRHTPYELSSLLLLRLRSRQRHMRYAAAADAEHVTFFALLV